MPAFKYKDLMISVGHLPRPCFCFGWSFQITYLPKVKAEEAIEEKHYLPLIAGEYPLGGGLQCVLHTTQTFQVNQYLSPLHCPNYTPVAGGGTVSTDSETLAALKGQLRQAIANIEQAEKAEAEATQPQTEAEVEEMQGKLREAMAELEKRKEKLHKK